MKGILSCLFDLINKFLLTVIVMIIKIYNVVFREKRIESKFVVIILNAAISGIVIASLLNIF